jgi:hypothetical protein
MNATILLEKWKTGAAYRPKMGRHGPMKSAKSERDNSRIGYLVCKYKNKLGNRNLINNLVIVSQNRNHDKIGE